MPRLAANVSHSTDERLAGRLSDTGSRTPVPEFIVPPEFTGQRLDRFLVSVLGEHSRSHIQKLIVDGHVTVEPAAAVTPHRETRRPRDRKANMLVSEGDRILVTIPDALPVETSAEPLPLDILHQDADVVVVNKPAGMVVHPGAGQ